MPKVEHKIYENNEILKNAITKALLSLNKKTGNILFINISYSEIKGNETPYSGMQYIVNLRGEQKSISPVLYIGFENLESLKQKPKASILNSPAVEYIKMPFRLSDFIKKIDKLLNSPKIKKSLDKETERKVAEDNLNKFNHDCKNVIIYLSPFVEDLKDARENNDIIKKNIEALKTFGKDFITKRREYYKTVRAAIEDAFISKGKGREIAELLDGAEENYKVLYREPRKKAPKIETIMVNGNKIITAFEKIKEILGDTSIGK